MKISLGIFILLLTMATGQTAYAEETVPVPVEATAESTTTYLMCKNKSVVRTVRVLKKESGGCQTTYTKEGIDQVVSESQWGKGCRKVLNNIRENLEKASWKCKDISDARVSFSND